jgi:copper chaperone
MFSLNVSGMGCGSCVSVITKAIQTLDQDARVEVDRAAGKVTVEYRKCRIDPRADPGAWLCGPGQRLSAGLLTD